MSNAIYLSTQFSQHLLETNGPDTVTIKEPSITQWYIFKAGLNREV